MQHDSSWGDVYGTGEAHDELDGQGKVGGCAAGLIVAVLLVPVFMLPLSGLLGLFQAKGPVDVAICLFLLMPGIAFAGSLIKDWQKQQ